MGKLSLVSVTGGPPRAVLQSQRPRLVADNSELSDCPLGTIERKMILNVDQIQWQYRAEGNANLVLALPGSRQVLRLKKVDSSGSQASDAGENFQFLRAVVSYIKELSSLILQEFVIDPQLVILMVKDMDLFNKQLNQYRPVDRLGKEIRFPFGIMYPDVTFLPPYLTAVNNSQQEPVFCVEVKPKQGWKFDESADDIVQFQKLFQVADPTLLTKCRYCIMQHLKYKKGKIHTLSKYCPLDLFSGNPAKMNNAIRNLVDCPQNNLRIFRNGRQVYGDQQYHNLDRLHNVLEEIFCSKDPKRNLQQFTQLVCNMLLKEYTLDSGNRNSGPGVGHQQTGECRLPVNCVLQQVLNVQRCVYDFFTAIKLNDAVDDNSGHQQQCDNRHQIIQEELLSRGNFKPYRYGATALDCSLMITFQKRGGSKDAPADSAVARKFQVQQDNKRFLSQVTIMDLDPKPFTHAAKYVEQTQASYQAEWSRRQTIY